MFYLFIEFKILLNFPNQTKVCSADSVLGCYTISDIVGRSTEVCQRGKTDEVILYELRHCLLLSTQPINRTWSLTCSWMQAWKSANLSTIKKHVFQLWYQYKHMYLIHMKEYAAPVTDNGGWPLVNESSWNKNRIAFQILTSFPCVEKYKISAALLYFATIHLREVSHQYPWRSLAYSFICT